MYVSQTKFHDAMETAVRNVRSVVDRDQVEMNGVVQAAIKVTSGAEHVKYHGRSPEQLYDYMGKLSDSFNIIRSDVFYVSTRWLFPFFLRFLNFSFEIEKYIH